MLSNVLSPKRCVSKETKDIYVKAFNMVTNKNAAKTMIEYISCDCNANSIVQHGIQNENGIIKHFNFNVKIIVSAENIIVGILAYVFLRIVSV